MEISIKKWIERFDKGGFNSPDIDTQVMAGWYDWFCRDTSMANKTKALGKKVKVIAKSPKVNADTMYVFFKNNCPCCGSLYDDFRICDMESGDVIYTIVPSSGFDVSKGKAEVYGRENNFREPLVSGTWRDVRKFFEV